MGDLINAIIPKLFQLNAFLISCNKVSACFKGYKFCVERL